MIAFKYIYIICKNIKINKNRDNNIKKDFHYIIIFKKIIMINNNNVKKSMCIDINSNV